MKNQEFYSHSKFEIPCSLFIQSSLTKRLAPLGVGVNYFPIFHMHHPVAHLRQFFVVCNN